MKKLILATSLILTCLSTTASEFYHKCSPLDTNEITSLACNVYWESRGESRAGQIAVAFNTLNRVDSELFPNTVRAVVWERKQYSWTHDGKSDVVKDYKAYIKALQIATEVYNLKRESYKTLSIIEDSLWYHNNKVHPYWAEDSCKVATIDNHIYYNCIKYK